MGRFADCSNFYSFWLYFPPLFDDNVKSIQIIIKIYGKPFSSKPSMVGVGGLPSPFTQRLWGRRARAELKESASPAPTVAALCAGDCPQKMEEQTCQLLIRCGIIDAEDTGQIYCRLSFLSKYPSVSFPNTLFHF